MKQAIELTPSAIAQLNAIMALNPHQHVRVGVNNKGCSGHSYTYDLIQEHEIKKFDEKIKLENGLLVIEATSLLNLLGSTLDYKQDKLGSVFVWNNPNVKNTCGCGESIGF